MKKFRYRLQALLKMKEHIEKERQKELATSLIRVQNQQRRLGELEDSRYRSYDRQRAVTAERFSVAEMLVVSRFIHRLKRESVMGAELLKVLKKDEDNKRQHLLEATKERRKYEKLKERQSERHYKEAESTLTKESDEIAISTFRQRKPDPSR